MSFRAAIIAAVIAFAGMVSADTMVTYYSYTFDYTYPEPSVQSVVSDVSRPIRIDVQVVGGDDSPLDIDGFTLAAAVISSDDNRQNQIATATAVNGTNGQYLINVTPTRDGTAQIKVDAYDSDGGLVAMVGQFDLTVTSAPAQASVINVTNSVSVGDTSVTNIFESGAFVISVSNTYLTTGGIVSNVSDGTSNSWDAGTGELTINTNIVVDTGITGLTASADSAGVVAAVDGSNWTVGTNLTGVGGGDYPPKYFRAEWTQIKTNAAAVFSIVAPDLEVADPDGVWDAALYSIILPPMTGAYHVALRGYLNFAAGSSSLIEYQIQQGGTQVVTKTYASLPISTYVTHYYQATLRLATTTITTNALYINPQAATARVNTNYMYLEGYELWRD